MKKILTSKITSISLFVLWISTLCLYAVGSEDSDIIKPVEYYKDVRGSIVFKTYCVLCHGTRADGKGRAARNYTPSPANLTVSMASDQYKEMIIRKGGGAMGRSPFMPPWSQELTDEQIQDVVYYLKIININNKKVSQKGSKAQKR